MVYFVRYFVSNILWENKRPESVFIGGGSYDPTTRGGTRLPAPAKGGGV